MTAIYLFFFIYFISWRLIILQYCSGFCHILTWIKIWNASRICMSSLLRGHANLLCILPILVYVLPKRALVMIFLKKSPGWEKYHNYYIRGPVMLCTDSFSDMTAPQLMGCCQQTRSSPLLRAAHTLWQLYCRVGRGGGGREMASKDLLWRTILPSEFLGGWLGLCSASPPRVFLSSPFHPFLSKGDNCKVYPQWSSSFLISKSQLSNWDTWKQWLWLLKLILKQEDF